MATVSVRSLTKRFGPTVAVDDLSFDVAAGSVTGFLGPNGAGKTTTLRCLLGLVAPTGGSALIDGARYRDLPHPTRTVGAVLEGANFHDGRTGRNHLRVVARSGELDESRIDETLDLVALGDVADKRVAGYSLGMRQRLGISAALLGDPDVLLLDEPANGLDPEGIRWLRGFLRELAAQGKTVLVSSHVLAEVAQTVDRVVVIGKGRLIAESSLEELTRVAQAGVRVRTPDAARLTELLRAAGHAYEVLDDQQIVVLDATNRQVGELCAGHGIVIHELVLRQATLEDVFLELTKSTELGAT